MISSINLSYDDCWLKAEQNYIDGLLREALYYYEEAYFISKKENNIKGNQETLLKVSKILNSYKEYYYSKMLYNFVFHNLSFRTSFTCNSSTSCCTEFRVDINIYDVIRILENKPELKQEDFLVDYDKNEISNEDLNNLNLKGLNNQKLTLKKQHNKKDCIFLENKLCKIHDFKPLVCQNWPMYLNDEDEITFMHLDSGFIRKNCHYTLEQENTFEEELKLKKRLREFKYNHYDSFEISNKIRENNKDISFNNYLNEIEKITKRKNKIISDITELIKSEPQVKNIKLTFEDKKTSKLEINILVELSNNTESLKLENLIKKLSSYNLLKTLDSNITLEKDNFLISINFSDEYKTYNNQKILYGSDIINNSIILNNIHFNKEIVSEILKASLIIIKYYIKSNNITELEKVLLNIDQLKKSSPDSHELSYYFDLIHTEELKIKGNNTDLILEFIDKCISTYPNKSIKFELLKLSLIRDENQFNEFIQHLIIKYKSNFNKLKNIFLALKENNNIYFSNEILDSIKFTSKNLIENKEYTSLIKIIENHISNINVNEDSYDIFYWLGISYLRISDYKKALDIFKSLKNKFPRNLELLLSIGDELYEEELYNETVEYLSLALNLITYKSNPQEFNIICEIILEILINTDQTSKANKILNMWKKANIKESDKILFIKISEVKLSNNKNKDKILNQLFNNTEYSYFEFYILSKINNKLITLPININLFF